MRRRLILRKANYVHCVRINMFGAAAGRISLGIVIMDILPITARLRRQKVLDNPVVWSIIIFTCIEAMTQDANTRHIPNS